MRPVTTLPSPTAAQLTGATLLVGVLLAATGTWSQMELGDRLLPHAFCISGSQPLLLLHLVSDGLIALAYLAIPWTLLNIARRRRDIPFGWVAWLFGAFIVACGATHAFEVWTLYYPVYWLSGVAKAFTAAVSLGTAWILYRLTPALLGLPSSAELRSANEALGAAQAKVYATLAELGRAEELLQTVLSTARDGVIVMDDALQPLICNTAARRLFHLDDAAPPEATDFLAAVEQPAQARSAIQASGPATTLLVLQVAGRDGERSTVEATVSRFTLQGRQLITLVGRDATQRRAAEEALVRSNQRLQQFAFIASHDLRSPLRTISGMVGVVHADLAAQLSPLHQDLFRRVQRAVEHMGRLTGDLLAYARAEAVETAFAPVPLADVTAAALDLVRGPLQAAGGAIDAGPLPVVRGDATQLTQLFVNLFDNAIKYRSAEPPRVTVRAERADHLWRIVVTDNGIGVAPEHREHIFEIFKRLHRQEEVAGTGIGLAISRRIAERHGGSIRADGAPGGGTTFTLTLPAD